jgi:hypothetical protein
VNGSPPLPANGDTLDSGSRSVPHRAAQFMADREGDLPVWVRAPKRGHEFYSGCSRAKLYEWAAKGFIRSVSIREPGRIKGVRLFHLASILTFIEQCEVEAKSNQKDSLTDTKPMTLPSLSTSAPPEP